MKKLSLLLNKTEDELFDEITSTFINKITQWDYFVNWEKVLRNIKPVEKELNLLNTLIGKDNMYEEAKNLFMEYPKAIKAIPHLLAIRENSIDILIDTKKFIYRHFDFTKHVTNEEEASLMAEFLIKSGLGELIKKRKIKNLVDYVTGVEVGLDSNGRKNRGGTLMETIVEEFIMELKNEIGIEYITQANAKKIKEKWNINIKVDKSSRRIDFVIKYGEKLYFIEVNFYGGGGSKLKSTATEYTRMYEFWTSQGITFIWITDGHGWLSTLKPLREYFDKADYLLNLEMLRKGTLKKILEWENQK